MYNMIEMLIGIITGSCFIVYGITRTETSFDMLKYKNEFVKAYKINYLIVGILILILSFLLYIHVLSINTMSLYFLLLLSLKSIIQMFIQFKYSKKLTN